MFQGERFRELSLPSPFAGTAERIVTTGVLARSSVFPPCIASFLSLRSVLSAEWRQYFRHTECDSQTMRWIVSPPPGFQTKKVDCMARSSDTKEAAEQRIQNQRIGGDRRNKPDRRVVGTDVVHAGEERRTTPRRKVERRRLIDPTTCERDYSGDELEFMRAMDDYKRKSGRMFPTLSEVLEVVRSLGYAKPEPVASN
jgi:hypothetical protein